MDLGHSSKATIGLGGACCCCFVSRFTVVLYLFQFDEMNCVMLCDMLKDLDSVLQSLKLLHNFICHIITVF